MNKLVKRLKEKDMYIPNEIKSDERWKLVPLKQKTELGAWLQKIQVGQLIEGGQYYPNRGLRSLIFKIECDFVTHSNPAFGNSAQTSVKVVVHRLVVRVDPRYSSYQTQNKLQTDTFVTFDRRKFPYTIIAKAQQMDLSDETS